MRDSLPSKLTQRAVTNEDHSVSGEELPVIPAKRYFTIGEMAQLCAVKPHVLRYWEQEFAHLKLVKRGGNRCCYTIRMCLLFGGFSVCCMRRGTRLRVLKHSWRGRMCIMMPVNIVSDCGKLLMS